MRDMTVWYACGERSFFVPSKSETYRDSDAVTYTGIGEQDEAIAPGYQVNFQPEGFLLLFEFDSDGARQLLAALTQICSAPSSNGDGPEQLVLAGTSTSTYHLEPARLARSGDTVRFWVRQEFHSDRTIQFAFPDLPADTTHSMEVTVVDLARGSVLQQVEVSCRSNRLRFLVSVTYNRNGEVLRSRDYSPDPAVNPAQESIPGSVGEALVQTACLIR